MIPQLQALGHRACRTLPPGTFKANAIEWVNGRWVGGADPRSEGAAVVAIESKGGTLARQLERFDNLVSLFLTRAAEKGDAPFLWAKREGEWQSISWAEAARQVASLAASLKRIGLQPGDRVALVSENRPEWLIADLAIMAAGCVTVPTYTTNTTRDHAHVLGNSGARAVIVSNQKLAKNLVPAVLTSSECHHVIAHRAAPHRPGARLGQLPSLAEARPLAMRTSARCEAEVAAIGRGDLACIIYTSGTGGAPRGVQQHHGAILHNLEGCTDIISTDFGWGDEVFLSFLPASHAYEHTGGQHFPIALGRADLLRREPREARLQHRGSAADDHGRRSAAVRNAARADHQVDRGAGRPCRNICSHRALKIGGDKYNGRLKPWDLPMDGILSLTLRRKVRAKVRRRGRRRGCRAARRSIPRSAIFFQSLGITFLQGYGQTEAGPLISCNRPSVGIRLDTVGPPVKNCEVRIAEDGEIMVRGENVMHGYWRNPEETARVLQATAGSRPATSAISTRRAASSSPTARRT